jgi:hypothetical protein
MWAAGALAAQPGGKELTPTNWETLTGLMRVQLVTAKAEVEGAMAERQHEKPKK